MKAATIVIILSFVLLGQTDGNLDAIALNGRNFPMEWDATRPGVKDLNRLENRYYNPVALDIDPKVTLTVVVAPGDDETRFDQKSAATVTGSFAKDEHDEPESSAR